GSYGGQFVVSAATGAVKLDVPLDSQPPAGALFVEKTTSKQEAEIGDVVDYSLKIKNNSGGTLSSVSVTDNLPAGFAYLRGTARFGGAPLADPTGGGGPHLEFALGAIADGATATVTYRTRIGPGALQGNGTNRAQATAPGPPAIASNVAEAKVKLKA